MDSVDQVLGALNLEEKIALTMGADMWHTAGVERLGIDPIMVSDGPHGLRAQPQGPSGADGDIVGLLQAEEATCFPTASNIHASWDVDLVRSIGAAIAVEARHVGVSVVLGPGVNIKRSPLCGRNFEYISEDPYLTGEMGLAMVQGIQGGGVGTSVKHFAANNQETDRLRVDAQVDERTLREIYLSAFERIVTAGQPWTVMCSYNTLNGTRVSENRWLLTEVLREEWGFQGVVVSDWGAVAHRDRALRAGLDLEMPPAFGRSPAELRAALANGSLSMAELDTAVRRMLTLIAQGQDARTSGASVDRAAHHALARSAAAQGMVLLKNDGPLLPLAATTTLAVIGEFARTPRFQGGGSSEVTTERVDVALDVFGEVYDHLTFAPGYTLDGDEATRQQLLDEAVTVAAQAEACVLFVGLTDAEESEGYDRTTMTLSAHQVAVIQTVCAANPRTAVVLNNGSVVQVSDWQGAPAAILEAWLGGEAAGGAIVDVVSGQVNPSAKLCETIPIRLQDNSAFVNFPGENSQVRYGEGVFVGYRGHDIVDQPVSYPFGHGLSYTTFEIADLQVQTTGSVAEDTLSANVTVTVTNTGTRAGAEVVQVYVGDPQSSVARPLRELQGFAKVHLEPGESRTVTIALTQRAFSFWSTQHHRFVVESGEFVIWAGRSSRDLVASVSVQVEAPSITAPLHEDSTISEWLQDPVGSQALQQAAQGAPGPAIWEMPGMLEMLGNFPLDRLITFPGSPLSYPQFEDMLEQVGVRPARNAELSPDPDPQ